MSDHDQRRLTEEQARKLWERAARLQAEAAASSPTLRSLSSADETSTADEETMDMAAVRRAATEAGIDAAFLDAALLDLDDAGAGRLDQWADAYLPDDGPVAKASREIPGTAPEVYASLQRVLPNQPFGFNVSRVQGDGPLHGGTLVFDIPAWGWANGSIQAFGPMADLRGWADFRELRLRITEGDEDAARTRVEFTAPRAPARRINYLFGQGIGAVAGAIAGVIGMGVAFGISSAVGPPEALIGLMAGSATGLGSWYGVTRWWKRVYRYGQHKGELALEKVLDAVELDRKTGGAFRAAIPERPGDDSPGGISALLSGLE